jgi:hypothetical protein
LDESAGKSKEKKAPKVATTTVTTAKLGVEVHELAGAIKTGFAHLTRKHDKAFQQSEKIIAALTKVVKEISSAAKSPAENPVSPIPMPAALPPPGKFSLTASDLQAIASTATQLYYSIGGWSVLWDPDRSALINDAMQMALAHSKKNCAMELLDKAVQVSNG